MRRTQGIFPCIACLGQTRSCWLAVSLLTVLLTAGSLRAASLTLYSDTSWRATSTLGNLAGTPITSVGGAWEASHVGWNTSLAFDDSAAAGWHNAQASPLRGTYANMWAIWSEGDGANSPTPAYFRKVFTLDGPATSALLNVHVDDDAQVYLNGFLVLDDQDFDAGSHLNIDVTSHLRAGQNLIAVKAHDSWGFAESLAVDMQVQYIPEPSGLGLIGLGLGAVLCRRRSAAA